MQKNSFTIQSRDGLKLSGISWIPTSEPKAIVCLVHGLGEHSARYQHVAEFYAAHSIAMYSFDLRGHGESEGKRGHTPSLEHLLSDIELFIANVREDSIDTPIILYGHSLGGNLATNFVLKHPSHELKGVIITSPWFRLNIIPTKTELILANIMNSLYPSFTQSNGLDESMLSRDPKVGKKYISDPLVHNKISVRLFRECFEAGLKAIETASQVKIPMLLMHGTDDGITSSKGSEDFAQNAAENVSLKLWKDFRHETHNEIGKDEVLKYELEWINRIIN